MRKLLLIGKNVFFTKKEALGYYKAILNSYNFGDSLNDEDYEEIFGLIQYDESFEEKECYDSENADGNGALQNDDEEQVCIAGEEDIFIEDIKVSKVQNALRYF
jgi:hypothetical protein